MQLETRLIFRLRDRSPMKIFRGNVPFPSALPSPSTYLLFSTEELSSDCIRPIPCSRYLTTSSSGGHEAEDLEKSSSTSSDFSNSYLWLQGRVPTGFWSNKENQRFFMDWLGNHLGYTKLDDWSPILPPDSHPICNINVTYLLNLCRYKVRQSDFVKNHGVGVLEQFQNSTVKVVTSIYSDHEFYPWLFRRVPKGYFEDKINRLSYIKWLMEKVHVSEMKNLTAQHYLDNHGGGLLMAYGGSPQRILESLGDDEHGRNIGSYRERKIAHHWASLNNQREFLDSIGEKIGVKDGDLSPWYTVDKHILRKHGCFGPLQNRYTDSIYLMLKMAYPEHNWLPWRFKKVPPSVGRDPEIVKNALSYIEKECDIKKHEDWYQVSMSKLKKLKVFSIIQYAGGLCAALRQHRSDFNWKPEKFSMS